MKFSFLFLVTGFGNRKLSIAVIYKWPWASALEGRDQVPSELPRFLGSGRGSMARRSSLLTIFIAGLLAL